VYLDVLWCCMFFVVFYGYYGKRKKIETSLDRFINDRKFLYLSV
jgi:hypothetical protein